MSGTLHVGRLRDCEVVGRSLGTGLSSPSLFVSSSVCSHSSFYARIVLGLSAQAPTGVLLVCLLPLFDERTDFRFRSAGNWIGEGAPRIVVQYISASSDHEFRRL